MWIKEWLTAQGTGRKAQGKNARLLTAQGAGRKAQGKNAKRIAFISWEARKLEGWEAFE